jgi:hypothetical protein
MKTEFVKLTERAAMTAAIESAERCAALFAQSLQTLADYASVRMRNMPETSGILDEITKVSPSLPTMLKSLAAIDAKIRKVLP